MTARMPIPYGPRESCTIDTNRPFTARFQFAAAGSAFGYSVMLEQEGGVRRSVVPTPVRYVNKPGKGAVGSADAANEILRQRIEAGMTLVVSYWAGKTANEMGWLDQPCSGQEVASWHCKDAWNDPPWHTGWPFTCDKLTGTHGGTDLPTCAPTFAITGFTVGRGGVGVPTIAAGGLATASLAGIAYLFKRRAAAAAGKARHVHAMREGLQPIVRPRAAKAKGAGKGRGRSSAPLPQAADDDEEEDDEEAPAIRTKPKGSGARAGAGKLGAGGKKVGGKTRR